MVGRGVVVNFFGLQACTERALRHGRIGALDAGERIAKLQPGLVVAAMDDHARVDVGTSHDGEPIRRRTDRDTGIHGRGESPVRGTADPRDLQGPSGLTR